MKLIRYEFEKNTPFLLTFLNNEKEMSISFSKIDELVDYFILSIYHKNQVFDQVKVKIWNDEYLFERKLFQNFTIQKQLNVIEQLRSYC